MNPHALGILAALAAVIFVLLLLRRGILPERFAALWIIVSFGVLVLALFPQIVNWAAGVVGVKVPLNLVLFAAAVMLLLVSVQLSFEVGRLESRTRRLAEELAILTEKVEGVAAARQSLDSPTAGPDVGAAGEPPAAARDEGGLDQD